LDNWFSRRSIESRTLYDPKFLSLDQYGIIWSYNCDVVHFKSQFMSLSSRVFTIEITCTHYFLMNMNEAKMWVAGPKAVVFAGIKKLFGSAISKAHNSSSLLTPQCLSSPAIHAFTPQRATTRYHSPPLSSAVRSTKPQENCCSFLQPDHFYFAQILK
jgi:hypothetical protein